MFNLRKILEPIKKYKHFKPFFVGTFGLLVVSFLFFSAHSAKGGNLDNVTGYAWEAYRINYNYPPLGQSIDMDVGMEFLSFNCTNVSGECNNSNYGVNFDPQTGELTGYAYSPHYGWVKFGGLNTSEMPSGPGTTQVNAKFNSNPGQPRQIMGWARFCGPTPNPSLCTGAHISNLKNGNWDGWLSLRGDGYGVTYDPGTGIFGGYAWGGNHNSTGGEQVVGWVSFEKVKYEDINVPKVSIYADDTFLPVGGQTTIRWNGLNLDPGPDKCEAREGAGSQDTGAWDTPPGKNSPSGTFTTGPLNTKGTYIYEIRCQGVGGGFTAWEKVTITVGIRLYLIPSSFIVFGPDFEVDLSWYSDSTLNNCEARTTDNFGDVQTPWKAPGFSSLTTLSTQAGVSIKDLNVPVKFDLKCFDNGVEVNAPSVYVTRGYNEHFTFSNTKVTYDAQDNRYETTLKWTTIGMQTNSCIPTPDPDPIDDSWRLPKPKSSPGSFTQDNVIVPEFGSRTFTLTCTGESGKEYELSLTLNKNSGPQNRKYKEN